MPACTFAWSYSVQTWDLAFLKLPEVPAGPYLQPIKVPLMNSSPVLPVGECRVANLQILQFIDLLRVQAIHLPDLLVKIATTVG